jgi:hypothetical protein
VFEEILFFSPDRSIRSARLKPFSTVSGAPSGASSKATVDGIIVFRS